MIQKLTNRQIISTVEQYFIYKSRLNYHKNALKWELMSCGETEKANNLREAIKADNEIIGEFLDLYI